MQYDAFVSYSHKDAEWVDRYLLPVLNSWGLSIVLDRKDFLPGERLVRKIADCLSVSRHVLFICTQSFLVSEWCRDEMETVKAEDPSALRRKAIPIVLEHGAVPDLLSTVVWCNLAKNRVTRTSGRSYAAH